ncbi:MAG: hypothetical protein R2761_03755 [Acidimicrobiales bacterium]
MRSYQGRRKLEQQLAAAIVALVLVALVVFTSLPAGAAPIGFTPTPRDGWDTNGTVYATKIVGDTLYLGGSFTQVRSASGQVEARTNLAAVSLDTGALLPFRADTDTPVRAIEGDGTTVWVGGSFSKVNGAYRRRIAALDPATGQVSTRYKVGVSSTVYAIEKGPSALYLGGGFGNSANTGLPYLVKVDPATGAIDTSFAPRPNAAVRALALSGDRLIVGGDFTSISGVARSYVTALSAADATVVGGDFTPTATGKAFAVDVSPDGSVVYAGLGGAANRVIAWNAVTGARLWRHVAMGDVQAIRLVGGKVYFGFHEGFAGDTTVRLLAVDAAAGTLDPSFRPTVDSFWGVWAIDGTADALVAGGQFTTVQNVPTRGIASFAPAG